MPVPSHYLKKHLNPRASPPWLLSARGKEISISTADTSTCAFSPGTNFRSFNLMVALNPSWDWFAFSSGEVKIPSSSPLLVRIRPLRGLWCQSATWEHASRRCLILWGPGSRCQTRWNRRNYRNNWGSKFRWEDQVSKALNKTSLNPNGETGYGKIMQEKLETGVMLA